MNCRNCTQDTCIKKGKRNGKQRYYCKSCSTSFQESYSYNAYKQTTDKLIKDLLKESCGVRSIARIIGISTKTVLAKMLQIANRIKEPYFNKLGCSFEMDELFVKIANGHKKNWVIHAIEKETRAVISFFVSNNVRKESIRRVSDKLLLLHPKYIYTDGLPTYKSLIPKKIHKVFQYKTNRIERKKLTLRTHIKRLSRKTICFSRKEKYLEAHLRIYFWG